MSAQIPARRIAKAIVRQLRLSHGSRILHVGCGRGEVVRLLRRAGHQAYGLFDGPAQERDENEAVPEIQPATLHQSLPFLAQSFDGVFVEQNADYEGPLSSPQACTATANLLAALKPGATLLSGGQADFSAMKQHLAQFPGKGAHLSLGACGGLYWTLRLLGLARPGLPVLKFTIPHEAISRLEWHRIARKAVDQLNRSHDEAAERAADSPAA